MNLLKSTGTIAGLTMVSRVFGFVRDILLARILGAGAAADAWQLAFQLPNIFRRLFAEGAFSAAFVPLFNRHAHGKDGEEKRGEAERFSAEILSIFVPALLIFTAIIQLAMPAVIWFLDDFGKGGQTGDFTIALARITFVYLGLISVTTLAAGILNSLSRFAAAAAAPILLNICLISALLAGYFLFDGPDQEITTAYLMAFGVAAAGLLQMLWLFFWVRKAGFRLRIKIPRLTPDVRELGVLILPAIFGAGVYQISRLVDLFFLGQLPEGSRAYMAFADRLNQLPLGIIGIALGTAILPALSRFIARDDRKGAQKLQSNAIELGMLLTIPAAVALFITAEPLVRAIFVGGNFQVSDGATTAMVVSALVIGLPSYVMVKVLVPAYFARKDTKTPVYTAGISLALNITLNLILIPIYGIVGLAVAGAVASWVNTSLLYAILHFRGHFRISLTLFLRILRIAVSAVGMAVLLIAIMPLGDDFYGGNLWERVISITILVGLGGLAYAVLAWVTGAVDRDKIALLTRRKKTEES